MYVKSNSTLDLLEMTVLATAIAGLLYFGYFQLTPWIWGQNLPFTPEDTMPWIHPWIGDRDGIELYALYVLMLLNLLSAYALTYGWGRLADRPVRYLLALPLVAVSCAFIGSIGFQPPMNALADYAVSDIFARSFTAMIVILPIIALLYYLQQRSTYWALAIAAILLIPVCFISTAPIGWYDYSFILAPALRLFHGAEVSEIYFQYDLLLSLIALAWIKLRFDLNSFQVVGQCAYYLLLLGLFAFSRRWFLDKRLSVFLLIALVLVRIYAGGDAVHSFQLTPLRLDLWLILLMLVYFKGPYHWSMGLFCGLMLLLHKSFGIIYSAAYIQLLLTLCVIDTALIPGKLAETASSALRTFFKKNHRNFVIILAGAIIQYLLFRNADIQGNFGLVNLRIGFLKIATNSFYWYVVVVSGLAFALLIRLRAKVSGNYLATGFCLIYLAIGNSLYFFGRSHENNIINISAILLVLFFLLLDIASHIFVSAPDKPAKPFIHRNLAIVVSLAFIASITIWYGDNLTDKVATQWRNAGKGQFIYPPEVPEQDILNVLAEIKTVTGDNPKVYFVGDNDFLLNYYGGYTPVGYYSPVYAWISKREFNKFLLGLSDQGYYLVIDDPLFQDMPSAVKLFNYRIIGRRFVVWK